MEIFSVIRDDDIDLSATGDIVCISEDELLYLNHLSNGNSLDEISKTMEKDQATLEGYNQRLCKELPEKSQEIALSLSKATFELFSSRLDKKVPDKLDETNNEFKVDESKDRLAFLLKQLEQ